MRLEGVKRGKKTNGTVHYCEQCARGLAGRGSVWIRPHHKTRSYHEDSPVMMVSLSKRGRWAIMKYRPPEAAPQVPQYHYKDPTKGSCVCCGDPEPWHRPGNRPDFLFHPRPNMVVLTREEVMEALPASDHRHLANFSGHVADQWLCFFMNDSHTHEELSSVAYDEWVQGMSEEEFETYGMLVVIMSNHQTKGRAWECSARISRTERNHLGKFKSRSKAKGTNKSARKRITSAFEGTAC